MAKDSVMSIDATLLQLLGADIEQLEAESSFPPPPAAAAVRGRHRSPRSALVIARIGRIDADELAADKASIVSAFRTARARVLAMSLDEQLAPTVPAPPPTLPAPPPVKSCGCGRSHDRDEWYGLRFVGMQDDGEGGELELRNCQCGSTLGIETAA